MSLPPFHCPLSVSLPFSLPFFSFCLLPFTVTFLFPVPFSFFLSSFLFHCLFFCFPPLFNVPFQYFPLSFCCIFSVFLFLFNASFLYVLHAFHCTICVFLSSSVSCFYVPILHFHYPLSICLLSYSSFRFPFPPLTVHFNSPLFSFSSIHCNFGFLLYHCSFLFQSLLPFAGPFLHNHFVCHFLPFTVRFLTSSHLISVS